MIDRIQAAGGAIPSVSQAAPKAGGTELGRQFGEMLTNAIAKLDAEQQLVDELNNRFLAGDMQNIEQMLIAGEKASLHLELTVQIRNKVIEAYQEIMRMQI